MENDFNAMMEHFKNLQLPKSNFWKKYDDLINCLSNEQKSFVSKQNEVIDAKERMFSSFLDYLFDQKKEDFINVGDGKNKNVVQNYFDSIQRAADKYVSRSEQLEKENESLRNQLKMFMEQKNESMATNGNRRTRKENINPSLWTDNNSGANGTNNESISIQS